MLTDPSTANQPICPHELEARRLLHVLTDWFLNEALPAWWAQGTDHEGGGFFEKRYADGGGVQEPRRTRVVARQIYVFATGKKLGWRGPSQQAVEHGLQFLLNRLHLPAGHFAAAVQPDGTVVSERFDLYEQAFALFALAAAQRAGAQGFDLPEHAHRLLGCLIHGYKHPGSGFEEGSPPTLPLKSNPHMHLFEALIAWADLAGDSGGEPWLTLADEVTELCMTRFVDPASGALREYFAADWSPMPGEAGRVVEPGHQFEWAWLLIRWGRRRGRPDCMASARRLVALGERHGVCAVRGVAINELRDDFTVTDASAKLWPQTERIKAWCAMAEVAQTAAERSVALGKVVESINGLSKYLVHEPPGMWAEVMEASGAFRADLCRASSFYHIVCALETLDELLVPRVEY